MRITLSTRWLPHCFNIALSQRANIEKYSYSLKKQVNSYTFHH